MCSKRLTHREPRVFARRGARFALAFAAVASLGAGALIASPIAQGPALLPAASVTTLHSPAAASPAELAPPTADESTHLRWFNGRPIRSARTIEMRVTAYSPDEQSCGDSADGITASGYSVLTNGGAMVAADITLLPFGSLLSIPGYDAGNVVPVLDRGGAIKGHRLDVLFPTHQAAMEWGVQTLEVTVWEYVDGLPSGFRTAHRPR